MQKEKSAAAKETAARNRERRAKTAEEAEAADAQEPAEDEAADKTMEVDVDVDNSAADADVSAMGAHDAPDESMASLTSAGVGAAEQ